MMSLLGLLLLPVAAVVTENCRDSEDDGCCQMTAVSHAQAFVQKAAAVGREDSKHFRRENEDDEDGEVSKHFGNLWTRAWMHDSSWPLIQEIHRSCLLKGSLTHCSE